MIEKLIEEYYDEIGSTNDAIKERARAGEQEGLVISARTQTAGKGRVGRVWQSPDHDSIATSILLRPTQVPIGAVPTITILAAMAVRDALEETVGLECQIKWPNDIVAGGKKLCGILTEMEATGGVVSYVVCGIGVNVHTMEFPEDIAFKATSVDKALKEAGSDKQGHRSVITTAIWTAFLKYYNEFLKTSDLTSLKAEYEAHLVSLGQEVRIEDPAGAYTARCLGINDAGNMIIERDGAQQIVQSGEVSVRGLYGYV